MPIHVRDAATDRLAPRLAATSGSGLTEGPFGRRSNMSSNDSMRPRRLSGRVAAIPCDGAEWGNKVSVTVKPP